MTNKSRHINAINITVSFLFFAFLVVGFVFICSDTEYKLNQQMARGYITSDAVFFDFDNPSIKRYDSDVMYSDGQNSDVVSSKKEYDPDFVLQNKVLDDGMTSVEKLMTSVDTKCFIALHKDTMRAVSYRGRVSLPPLTSGRFFTEDECLSDKCYAVVGKNFENEIFKEDNKRYFNYFGRKYEVLGITGIASKSAMDSIIFINIGSLTPDEQLNGMYYVDCSKDNKSVYKDIAKNAKALFGCELKIRKTPIAYIDIASGEMYMKNYLFVILAGLMVFAYVNTLVQYTGRQRLKVSIMKLCGVDTNRILNKTGRAYIIDCAVGIIAGIAVLSVLLYCGAFALEYSYVAGVVFGLSVASICFAAIGYLVLVSSVLQTVPQEIIRQV